MKKTIIIAFFATMILSNVAFAQKADSSTAKKDSNQKSDYFSKYKKKPNPTSNSATVNETWNLKKPEKKVESSYKTDGNGRVTGGSTTLKLGKKNQ